MSNKCPECGACEATHHTVGEHFQGYEFVCGSVPAHSWAGRPHVFNQSKRCFRTVISHLRKALAELATTPCPVCEARVKEEKRRNRECGIDFEH